ncbi:MAG: ABC transporter ATP-binding protein [Lachnospiraceae bacterium]|nr:ABC transporter ATP-binding protein [Lachnospiraceae bacterium]
MNPIIEVKNLTKQYKEVTAVDGIHFQVEKGELFGFLGVNGAGKSTTIGMLCTVFAPTAGEIEICGLKVGKEDEEIRRRIGVVYQNNCLDDRLTVKENLFIRGSLYEKNSQRLKENIFRICEILDLDDIYGRKFHKLSGGQKRRCEIARALVHTPQIMFLDEPTTGLDPATRKAVWESLSKLQKEDKMTIFLTTHYMEEAAKASHIAIIDKGQILEYGTPFTLKETYGKDKLRLSAKQEKLPALKQTLDAMGIAYKSKEDYLVTSVSESLSALPILNKTQHLLSGFEVVQGSMDDVFLNVTGKKLEA